MDEAEKTEERDVVAIPRPRNNEKRKANIQSIRDDITKVLEVTRKPHLQNLLENALAKLGKL